MLTEHVCELFMFKWRQNGCTGDHRACKTSLKLLYGSSLSFMKSSGELTRPTQFVRCVELNFNTSATQLIWETTLRDPTQRWREAATSQKRWSRRCHGFNWTLRERSWLPNPSKFYCIGFKTVFSRGERWFSDDDPRYKIPPQRDFSHTDALQETEGLDTLMTAGRSHVSVWELILRPSMCWHASCIDYCLESFFLFSYRCIVRCALCSVCSSFDVYPCVCPGCSRWVIYSQFLN